MKGFALPLLLLSQLLSLTSAQVYISITDMEKLLDTQQLIVDDLSLYIQREEKRIEHLKRTIKTFTKENKEARHDVDNYLGNPVKAFTLIKRLSSDLDFIEKWSNLSMEQIKAVRNRPGVKYATQEDLKEAAKALVRVKDMYKLDISDLVKGNLKEFRDPMMTSDCFELAKTLYNCNDYKNALALFSVALNKYNELEDGYELTKTVIMEYIAYTHYLLGETQTALAWNKILLDMDPENARAKAYNFQFNNNYIDFQKQPHQTDETDSAQMEEYKALCRGDISVPDVVTKSLRCRYMSETHPFLRLAPFKQEQVYSKPDIYLFYDVISDDEIQLIKNISKPTLNPSTTSSLADKAKTLVSWYRLSKTTYIDDDNEVAARVTRRVRDMTGLDTASSELLQVVNYGVGGHYYWHHDSAIGEDRHTGFPGQGNRMATVLFYLSDVALGGATVFTNLGLRVLPKKNSAVFWSNLHPSGEPDYAVIHASCAVAKGSKWIATKWLHQYGQELIRPCGLEYQPQGFQGDIVPPVHSNKRFRNISPLYAAAFRSKDLSLKLQQDKHSTKYII